jgi:hypothetical protein
MSKKKTIPPQYARVEQPFGCRYPAVHCPICGQANFVDEEGVTPCPHLAFNYVGELGDFDHQSDSFAEKTAGVEIDELDFDTMQEFLTKAGYDNSLLVLEITYGGMGCGPVWYTDVYGFDFATMAAEE